MTDFEDWTLGISIIESGSPLADVPDWSTPVEIVSGGGGGGYASLTGAGQTTTPGLLSQAGGFDISDTIGGGVSVFTNGSMALTNNNGNPLLVENAGTGGIKIYAPGTQGILILADTNAQTIHIEANGTTGTNVVNIESVGSGGGAVLAGGANAGAVTATSGQVTVVGRNFVNLIYGQNTAAAKGSRGVFISDAGTGGSGAHIFTNAGNPNGVFNGSLNGDLCIDTTTPNLWQWHSGSTSWVAL